MHLHNALFFHLIHLSFIPPFVLLVSLSQVVVDQWLCSVPACEHVASIGDDWGVLRVSLSCYVLHDRSFPNPPRSCSGPAFWLVCIWGFGLFKGHISDWKLILRWWYMVWLLTSPQEVLSENTWACYWAILGKRYSSFLRKMISEYFSVLFHFCHIF